MKLRILMMQFMVGVFVTGVFMGISIAEVHWNTTFLSWVQLGCLIIGASLLGSFFITASLVGDNHEQNKHV